MTAEHMTENTAEKTQEHLMVTLRVPITYQMYGYANIQVPINASEDDILEACDNFNPDDLADTDLMIRGNGGPDVEVCRHCHDTPWKVHLPEHLEMLALIGDALASLDAKNILAFANECCNTDSASYGQEKLAEEPRYIGFAFIHSQNVENILDDGVCHVGFCSRNDAEAETTKAIAETVCEALRETGLTVTWEGDIDSKIEVTY